MNLKLRLPDYYSLFQAEVVAEVGPNDWIRISIMPIRRLNIYSDSQVAMRALGSFVLRPKWVGESLISISLGRHGFLPNQANLGSRAQRHFEETAYYLVIC